MYRLLETKDRLGLSCLSLAISLEQAEIVEYLLSDEFPQMEKFSKDTFEGDLPLHIAVRKGNLAVAKILFELRPEKCL